MSVMWIAKPLPLGGRAGASMARTAHRPISNGYAQKNAPVLPLMREASK